MPAARQRSRSPCIACAVSATIGVRAAGRASRRADRRRRLEAVHLRHLHVHQHDVEALRRAPLDRLAAVVDDRRPWWPALLEQPRATRWLTGLSSASRTCSAPRRRRRGRPPPPRPAPAAGAPRPTPSGTREVERAARRGRRSRPQSRPPISSHQLRRDRQAEAGAAVLARRRAVGLRERLEDRCCLLRRRCRCRCRVTAKCSRAPLGRPARPSTPTVDRHRRLRSVNLIALPTRLISTWRSRTGSPTSDARHVGGDVAASARALSRARAARAARSTSSTTLAQVEARPASSSSLPASIFEKSRMSLMTCEQRLGRRARPSRGSSRCSAVELRVERQLGHADDAVHRRADLVAHVGEELRLEARRLHGRRRAPRPASRVRLLDIVARRSLASRAADADGVARQRSPTTQHARCTHSARNHAV